MITRTTVLTIPLKLVLLVLLAVSPSVTLKAAEKADPALQKLREANAKLATAQAAQADDEEKIKDLQGQLEELTKKSSMEKRNADQLIDDLKTKLSADDLQVAHLGESLGKWKFGYAKLADYARQTEGKRAELASKIILLDRRIADQQVKNAEMYRLAGEVLDRYANFGLGTAIAAREPFVGITKVKFQNLVQDYQNKLADQTIKHDDTAAKKTDTAANTKPD